MMNILAIMVGGTIIKEIFSYKKSEQHSVKINTLTLLDQRVYSAGCLKKDEFKHNCLLRVYDLETYALSMQVCFCAVDSC